MATVINNISFDLPNTRPVGISSSNYTSPYTTGCILWLDATDTSSMTLSSTSVTTWSDKSGVGNHMTNTGTYPKTGGATKINNLNVLDFTNNAFLQNTTMSFSSTYTILQ